MANAAASRLDGGCPRQQPSPGERSLLFRGLSLSFLGFDEDSLHAAVSSHPSSSKFRGAAPADAAAARTLLRQMEGWAVEVGGGRQRGGGAQPRHNSPYSLGFELLRVCGVLFVVKIAPSTCVLSLRCIDTSSALVCIFLSSPQEGVRVVNVSREGLGAASLFVCNFAAAFAHLRRLAEQQQQQQQQQAGAAVPQLPGAPHLLLAAINLEPLRLLTPFWLFACLRDRRVYAPDAHPLFRVSPAFIPSRPPLLLRDHQQQQLQQEQHKGAKQRVLLVGFTRRRRRVRLPSGFIHGMSASESDEEAAAAAKKAQPAARGRAIAVHDLELAATCVDALGGQCVSAADLKLPLSEGAALVQETSAAASAQPEASACVAVDLVVVGHLPRLLKRGLCSSSEPCAYIVAARGGRVAAAELPLLQKLQQRGVACVRLQWLFDAYRLGRAPPPQAYVLSPQQCRQQVAASPAAPCASARRQQLLQGVCLLISDAAALRDPALLQRAGDLGCTDVAAVPSLLGLCPWLFGCSATRQLAAILCGSRARMRLVDAALQRAEQATQQQRPPSALPPLILVLLREELPGLLDLAAAVAEAIEPTAPSQPGASTPRRAITARRAASRRTAAGHMSSASQQQQQQRQQQKQQQIWRLLAAAQQRVLQFLTASAAKEVQRHWLSAVEAASEQTASTEAWGPQSSQSIPSAFADARPTVVTPEWIVSSWEEARRLPLDSAHGLVEVPDFWMETFSSESANAWEDSAVTKILKGCGGAVVYWDFPEVADATETRQVVMPTCTQVKEEEMVVINMYSICSVHDKKRTHIMSQCLLRRALGALEHALSVSWEVQQQRQGGGAGNSRESPSP
ncbi:hypothetical protein Esti_000061 [Eimeria stiedai]